MAHLMTTFREIIENVTQNVSAATASFAQNVGLLGGPSETTPTRPRNAAIYGAAEEMEKKVNIAFGKLKYVEKHPLVKKASLPEDDSEPQLVMVGKRLAKVEKVLTKGDICTLRKVVSQLFPDDPTGMGAVMGGALIERAKNESSKYSVTPLPFGKPLPPSAPRVLETGADVDLFDVKVDVDRFRVATDSSIACRFVFGEANKGGLGIRMLNNVCPPKRGMNAVLSGGHVLVLSSPCKMWVNKKDAARVADALSEEGFPVSYNAETNPDHFNEEGPFTQSIPARAWRKAIQKCEKLVVVDVFGFPLGLISASSSNSCVGLGLWLGVAKP